MILFTVYILYGWSEEQSVGASCFDKLNLSFVSFQGRILGITIGCLIGMTPLLFMDTDKDKKKKEEEAAAVKKAATAPMALN